MPRKHQQRAEKVDSDSILEQIERVVRWGDEFRLAFIKCNHPAQQETLRRSLLERLSDQRILEIPLEKPVVSLLDEIRLHWNPSQPPVAVCVYGLENSLREQSQSSPMLGRLNHERDLLRQSVPAALLIWAPDFALDYVARGAPDFWAWRSGVYEFQTDSTLWQLESITAFNDHDAVSLSSLSWEDKQKEITRIEELLRTSQALTRQDKQVKQTNCHLLNQLGFLYKNLGKQDEALDRYRESLKLAKSLGDRAGEGTILNNLSQIYRARGDYETALRYLEESLAIRRAIGDRAKEGTILNNLSQIYRARGDYETALRYLEEALTLQRTLGDRAGEGSILNNLSQIYHARGDYDTALRYLEEALTLQRAISDRAGEGVTLNNLSQIYDARGDYDTALRYLEEALALQRVLGDRVEEGTILNNLSQIYDARGDYETAQRYLEESLAISRAIGDRAVEGRTLNNLAQIYQVRGDDETALRYLEESLAIQRAIGDRAGLCPTLFNMGHIYWQKNEHQQALACWVAVYRIAKEIGYAEVLAALENLAKQLGGSGLEDWERLSQQMESGE